MARYAVFFSMVEFSAGIIPVVCTLMRLYTDPTRPWIVAHLVVEQDAQATACNCRACLVGALGHGLQVCFQGRDGSGHISNLHTPYIQVATLPHLFLKVCRHNGPFSRRKSLTCLGLGMNGEAAILLAGAALQSSC